MRFRGLRSIIVGISIKSVLVGNKTYKSPVWGLIICLVFLFFFCVNMHCIFGENADVGKD